MVVMPPYYFIAQHLQGCKKIKYQLQREHHIQKIWCCEVVHHIIYILPWVYFLVWILTQVPKIAHTNFEGRHCCAQLLIFLLSMVCFHYLFLKDLVQPKIYPTLSFYGMY